MERGVRVLDDASDAAVPADACDAKRALRRHALSARDGLTDAERTRLSAAVCARAAALPAIVAAHTLFVFASFRSEVDTAPLIDWALAQGRRLCLPRVLGPRTMAAFRIADREADLVPGAWGIPEPREGLPEVPPSEIDAIVVPGAVFDASCNRCGYGGGFYDTYLPRTRPGTPRIALAFEVQVVDDLPCEPHDLAVDAIVTEARVIRPG
jgi:5-formyltetrahydrofolate cyclo-ligase